MTASEPNMKFAWTDRQIDLIISAILRVGMLLACAITFFGAVLYLLAHGGDSPQLSVFHETPSLRTVSGIVTGALQGYGECIMQLGVLLLLMTPIARVAFAGFAFAQQRDRTYVFISLIVLL